MAQELQGSALQASWLRIQIEDKKKFSGDKKSPTFNIYYNECGPAICYIKNLTFFLSLLLLKLVA